MSLIVIQELLPLRFPALPSAPQGG